jgi:hypothetical protein
VRIKLISISFDEHHLVAELEQLSRDRPADRARSGDGYAHDGSHGQAR